MADLIDRRAAIDELKKHRALYCDNTPDSFSKLSYAEKSRVDELDTAIAILVNQPSAQPEQKIDELLQDGTLHLSTDADLSTVGRVLVSQNGTHYGGLYYADGEQKRGGSEFISWLLDEIWDEEMWELNYRAFPELLCRRLVKAGWLKEEGGKYVRLDKQTGGD